MATEKDPLLDRAADAPTEQHEEEMPATFGRRLVSPWTRRMAGDYFRQVVPGAVLVIIIWSVIRATFIENHHWSPGKGLRSQETLVALEAHIMSKCPDAKDCLEKLVVPAMVQVSDKVNFTLSYIGSVDPDSDEVHCMHGPGECLGNIIQLCAAKEYPDPKIYLGFANCMTSEYKDIPERSLVEDCAMEFGVDFKTINACISDEGEGMDLLRASVERSHHANVTKSCTVRLAGEVRCIRDGGEWYDCPGGSNVTDLVQEIKDLYDDDN